MKFGCHAVLFKEQIALNTEEVFKKIQETGFAGAEIGSRFFGTEKKEYLKEMLEKYQIHMSGMHSVIQLRDLLDCKDEAFATVRNVIELVKKMPYKNVILTGMHKLPEEENTDPRLRDPEMVKEIAIRLNELAQLAREEGVQIHYHNHSWEFEDDALIFHSIGKYAKEMYFALDTGWAFSMGYDPVQLLEQYEDRIHYVHLRDYNQDKKEFGNIGEGSQDYLKLIDRITSTFGENDWAIVEYETGEEDHTRYTRAFEYLQRLIKE